MDYEALARQTLPGLLVQRARRTPDRVAYRAKELGIYRETSWREVADRVASVALALQARGLAAGETVAIMGNPCPEWSIADLAAQTAGAITYGIYATSSPGELRFLLQHGAARFLIAENQEHLDKALGVWADCPGLEAAFVIDTRALFMYRDPRVTPFASLERDGRARLSRQADALADLAARVDPAAPATIVYTSGTTGAPKGAILRHGAHIAAAANLLGHYPALAEGEHRLVAFLPLSHVMGRDATITLPLLADLVPHYPENPDTVAETFYEVAPSFMFTVPRYLQKFASHLLVGLETSSPLKRAAYRAAMSVGRAWLERRWRGSAPRWLGLAHALARALVFRRLLDKVGFARMRLALSSGAPLAPETAALWQVWGLNLLEVYGQTEAGGAIISGQQGEHRRPGDVGAIAPNVRLALASDGEILARSSYFFAGYWQDPGATAEAFLDGALMTGDVGEWATDGTLRLIDRKKDFLITAGGKNISPAHVENRLRASAYISEAIVFGEGRKYLVALLELDAETVSEWARNHGVPYAGYTSLVTHPAVVRLIEAEVAAANEDLARVAQVKAFRVLPTELDPEQEGEPVTPTRKVKRRLMAERYRDLLEALYSTDEERRITAQLADLETSIRG
ncbi:MAG TPA: AMP-binding protein [Methylomirabilota bacterium]|jgi:long-chain acyl-CoA synthetase|nr:AMP-binding protein [Methylomirabilota bacterium]